MQSLTQTQKDELASMMLNSLELAKVPVTSYDVTNKQYVDTKVFLADKRVTDILAESEDAFNTLIELKRALDSGDASITTALTSALGTETGLRKAEDLRLSGLIGTETTNRESAVSSEASARSSADNALGARIDSEASARQSADSAHEGRLVAVEADISTLSGSLSNLEDKQSEDDTKRQSDISDESKRATQAETALGDLIEQEATRVNTAISTEEANRSATVNALATTVVNNRNAVQPAIDLSVNAVQSSLNSEISDRESAVNAVQSFLDEEVKLRDEQTQALSDDKFDKSTSYYKRESDDHFAIAGDAFLYIGDFWRIRANSDASSKRLEFEYSSDGTPENFRTAVPFIRGI